MKLLIAISVILLASNVTLADTIHFKNGAYIEVDKATEKDGEIEYWIGSTKYSIPKTAVEKIVKGGGPSISLGAQVPTSMVPPSAADTGSGAPKQSLPQQAAASKHDKMAMPTPTSPGDNSYWTSLRTQVSNGDHVDEVALEAIEKQGNTPQTSNAYFVAGVLELEHDNAERAGTYFEHALRLTPDEASLVAWYAMALGTARRYADAASQAEHLTRLKPDSAFAFDLLAAAQYNADNTRDAVRAWKRALELRPDPITQQLLEKAQRELEVEDKSNQQESRHFSLRYEGGQTSVALQRGLLGTLEEQYQELARELDYSPSENIIVTLYTQKQFFDITQAPAWAGGINDGKLRIPIQGVTMVTPALQHVLKHELTHSFVRFEARDRCPSWLNEGLAQLMESRSSSQTARALLVLFEQHKQIPFTVLERPFNGFSEIQAEVAYAESLAAVEYLRDRHGIDDVLRILRRIGSGEAPEAALRAVTGSDYADLEKEVGGFLAQSAAH